MVTELCNGPCPRRYRNVTILVKKISAQRSVHSEIEFEFFGCFIELGFIDTTGGEREREKKKVEEKKSTLMYSFEVKLRLGLKVVPVALDTLDKLP